MEKLRSVTETLAPPSRPREDGENETTVAGTVTSRTTGNDRIEAWVVMSLSVMVVLAKAEAE